VFHTCAALAQIGTGRVGTRANAASALATAMLAICDNGDDGDERRKTRRK
jgi:hypothetical protein